MHFLKELFKTYLLLLAVLFLGRVLLYLFYFDRLEDISFFESLLSFVYGMRMDTIVLSIILVIPALLLSISPKRFTPLVSKGLKLYILGWLLILIFIENATFPFFAQYDVRPNYLFIEYLEYPKEVGSLMFKEYKLELLLSFVMMFFAARLFLRSKFIDFTRAFQTPYHRRALLLLPLLLLLFIGIRSSFGHRGANTSDALYSSNRIINEITKDSLHSIGYAYYSSKKHGSKGVKSYGKIELPEAYKRASEILDINFSDPSKPFSRELKTNFATTKPKNLVIFIQESMGAQFVEFSGGEKDPTPNMNQLGKEYLAFSELYSNGTRSIRGLAAMSAGFLPVPGEGVVKRTKSQSDFFTLASLLKPYGYRSSFIYGGEARFDNMKSWYLGNGFDEVIEESDFEDITFRSTWGVCDEDLVVQAHKKFKEYHQNNEKFVSVMFSQSNHSPFELPENKIKYVDGVEKQSVKNAIRYADFAIGRFFELAKQEEYFKDTVFVVVADHNVRVYGDDAVPVSMFHIPAVIVADGLTPQTYNKLTSQPDVLATAIDMIGLDLRHPVLGHSIFSKDKTETVLMQYNDTYALRHKDDIAVVAPDVSPKTYRYVDKRLELQEHNIALEQAAIALITVLEDMYDKKLFK
ncbi:MAG: LTA synthase family protein [Sulfurimonas sp.]|jgi:phosphoglycerol transferase MdoB-like AlkP superfamily enzyme|nr:LTA synthase family protein [Sulfurimonas sp.]